MTEVFGEKAHELLTKPMLYEIEAHKVNQHIPKPQFSKQTQTNNFKLTSEIVNNIFIKS